jgi:hypothetical protein
VPEQVLACSEVAGRLEIEDRKRSTQRVRMRLDTGSAGESVDDPPNDLVVSLRLHQSALGRDQAVRCLGDDASGDRGVEALPEFVRDRLPNDLPPFSEKRRRPF